MVELLAGAVLGLTQSKMPVQIGDPFSGYSAVSADGTRVACRRLAEIQIWDTRNWTLLNTIHIPFAHGSDGLEIRPALSPDGKRVACIHSDNSFAIYDCLTGAVVRSTPAPPSQARGLDLIEATNLKYSPEGDVLFVPSLAGRIQAFSSSGEQLYSLDCTGIGIGRRKVVALHDGALEIRDIHSGEVTQTIRGEFDYEFPVALSADGQFAAAVEIVPETDSKPAAKSNAEPDDPSHEVSLWDVHSGKCLWRKRGPWASLEKGAIRISGDDKLVTCEGGDEVVLRLGSGDTVRRSSCAERSRSILSGESKVALRQVPGDKIVVTDLESGVQSTHSKPFYECAEIREVTPSASGHSLAVFENYSTEGTRDDILTASIEETWGTRIWNLSSSECPSMIPDMVMGVHFENDASILATHFVGTQKEAYEVRRHAVKSGQSSGTLMHVEADGDVVYLRPNPDGSGYLAIGGGAGQAGPFTYHKSANGSASMKLEKAYPISSWDNPYSPNGELLAGCSYPKVADASQATVDLWDLASGSVKHFDPMEGAKGYLLSRLQFSQDSSCLASGPIVQEGGQYLFRFRLWDVKTGEVRCRFDAPASGLVSFAVSPHNDAIAIGTPTGYSTYSVSDGKLKQSVNLKRPTKVLAFSADGSYIFTTSELNPGPIQKWRLSDGKYLGSLWGLVHGKTVSNEWISVDAEGRYHSSPGAAALLPH